MVLPEPAARECEQVVELSGQVVPACPRRRPPQGRCRARVGPRRPSDAQVNALGKQRFQGQKRLGHFERRMVRQHDPAGPDAHPRGLAGDLPDQNLR